MSLKTLLGFCEHKWDILNAHEMSKTGAESGIVKAIWHEYVLKCRHCGDLKRRVMRNYGY